MRRFISFLFLFVIAVGFCKTKEIKFEDQSYTLYISREKNLYLSGPWSDEPNLLDSRVRNVWDAVNYRQIDLVIQKDDEIDWMTVKRETGEKSAGGILQPLVTENGMIAYSAIQILSDTVRMKIVFDDGRFLVYEIDPSHGTKKILRRGKIPNFLEGK